MEISFNFPVGTFPDTDGRKCHVTFMRSGEKFTYETAVHYFQQFVHRDVIGNPFKVKDAKTMLKHTACLSVRDCLAEGEGAGLLNVTNPRGHRRANTFADHYEVTLSPIQEVQDAVNALEGLNLTVTKN